MAITWVCTKARYVWMLLGLAASLLLLSACDSIANYSVDNQTDQTLITRALFEDDCSQTGRYRSDYLGEEVVPPKKKTSFEWIYGTDVETVHCVQVLSADRRLILAEPYSEGQTYAVTDTGNKGLAVASDPATIPDQGRLDQFKEALKERPFRTALLLFGWALVLGVWAAFAIILPIAVPITLLVFARRMLRRRFGRPRPAGDHTNVRFPGTVNAVYSALPLPFLREDAFSSRLPRRAARNDGDPSGTG